MRRVVAFGLGSLRRGPVLRLLGWAALEAAPAGLSGYTVARAVDKGFLADRPGIGLAWLGVLAAAIVVGAVGSRYVYLCLADLVEPFRDDLVRRTVAGSLHRAIAGDRDDGAVARLSRQVEIVRDSYAGLIVLVNGFIVTTVGVVIGLLSIDPLIVGLMVPPLLLGIGLFLTTLGPVAERERACVLSDEAVAGVADSVIGGIRDVVATGDEERAAALATGPIERQASAERAMAAVSALRALYLAVGGWGPLIVLLAAAPWLYRHGLSAGGIMGGLTYVLFALQPALRNLHSGLGSAGVRFIVTLGRILQATTYPPEPPPSPLTPAGHGLALRGLSFAYGPGAEPVLDGVDLTVPEGDHVAIVGPSGIGKSTLAGLLCGLLRPTAGTVRLGGVPAAQLSAEVLAGSRVLIPQEAYTFTGTVWDNLIYLRPDATEAEVERAAAAIGASALLERVGGVRADLVPADLSAGERQLIALVRAYLSTAPIIVLDEATCHLDPPAERRAETAFAERPGTLIVIAHRISSVLRARRVVVLDGSAMTVGDHAALQVVSPLYRELLGYWEPASPGSRMRPVS